MDKKALENIKVADFCWGGAGPLMTKYLADYGATVIRIESGEKTDFLRTSGPYKDKIAGINRSGFFNFYNANKYSMELRLNLPKAVEVAKKMVLWADVVTESFSPGKMADFGLDYESLKKIRPDVIMLSSSGQGQTGPNARMPIAGNWLVALTGFNWFTGWPDRGPVQPFGAYNDIIAPRFGVIAILGALRHRQRTGKGQYIDISQLQAGLQFLQPQLLDYTVNGNQGERMGNASPNAAPHGVYPCLEGRWCAIAIFTDDQWSAFCDVIGDPSWTKETRFETLLDRKRNEEELNAHVSSWTENLTPEEVMYLLQKRGVPAGIVESPKDAYEDQQTNHRNYYWHLEHPEMGTYPHVGQTAILSKSPAKGERPSPCLGEHTEWVCRELLKMTDEEFIELVNEGVFGL
ncbi:CaiB/BaiF CoA transferase family protein [Thermodesulfobacteriota bacterium]